MRKFKLENVCHELMARAPLFYSTFLTSVFRQGRSNDKLTTSLPSVALAGCILLRERSPFLNAAQILMSLIMKFSGSQVNSSLIFFFILVCEPSL